MSWRVAQRETRLYASWKSLLSSSLNCAMTLRHHGTHFLCSAIEHRASQVLTHKPLPGFRETPGPTAHLSFARVGVPLSFLFAEPDWLSCLSVPRRT